MKPMELKKETWLMVYGSENKRCAASIVDSMKFANKKLGMVV
jgi:hypothetical protein